MVRIEAWLAARLATDTTLATILGAKIYPLKVPQGTEPPSITYRLTGCERDGNTLQGDGLAKPSFQIQCRSASYAEVKQMAAAIVLSLHGYQGRHESAAGDIFQLRSAWVTDESDDVEYPDDGSEFPLFVHALAIQLTHSAQSLRYTPPPAA